MIGITCTVGSRDQRGVVHQAAVVAGTVFPICGAHIAGPGEPNRLRRVELSTAEPTCFRCAERMKFRAALARITPRD